VRLSLDEFTFSLTEDCNFQCHYCFQTKRPRALSFACIQKALDYFRDNFQERCYISFYGGEPLLEFGTILRTIAFIENHETLRAKKFRYSISINGALLTDEVLDFLRSHKFRVNLSYDGTAQDITRQSDLNSLVLENLDRLVKLSDIEFETNSVFIPATVGEIFRSARFFIERGVKNCHLTYSIKDPWDAVSLKRMRAEVRELRDFLLFHYRRNRTIPVENFRSRPFPGLFWCAAGQNRLALAADGQLWGCRFFADYFVNKESHPEYMDYCLGSIHDFIADHEDVYESKVRNYKRLSIDNFSSERLACRKCGHLLYCSTCPATAAFPTGRIGKVATWVCEIKEIWLSELKDFWKDIEIT
jgi:radical SAM protein with 4Fe4S-binding SPASM domain